jgi:hypothetical protein
MVVLKEVAAERWGRSAMPFLTFAPAAVWVATTGDAFFGGVVAWSVALIVLAIHRNGRRADVLAVGGGILFGAALFLTYGVTLLAALPVSVAAARRRGRPLLLAALGVAGVVVAFRIAGFWWVAGLRATIVQYRASVARLRPQSYFWWANLATFAVVLGPTTAVALARLRDRRVWLVVAGALIAMAAADVTGLSRAEVERIWLPFAPWILAAGAVLVARRVAFRAWLALSMAAGLAVQVLLRTAW